MKRGEELLRSALSNCKIICLLLRTIGKFSSSSMYHLEEAFFAEAAWIINDIVQRGPIFDIQLDNHSNSSEATRVVRCLITVPFCKNSEYLQSPVDSFVSMPHVSFHNILPKVTRA